MTDNKLEDLEQCDPEIYDLIQKEQIRQWKSLELIASENFTSKAVLQAIGSILTNKYSEGYPGARYYGGNEIIDKIEELCIERALKAFNLDKKEWGVNVQPYSGSPANFAVYNAVLQPHDRIMGLDLPSGGHLTHGFYIPKKKISATSIYFESYPYRVGIDGRIDYDTLALTANIYRPRLIICGGSAYPREWDYARMRKIADDCGALLMADIAHIAGLVATGVVANPFPYCHIVTTTTHKTLRGPRAGAIFFRRDAKDTSKINNKVEKLELEEKINRSVFPSLQGGPHNNVIAAMAVQFKEVASPEFKLYAKQVIMNAKALADALMQKGHKLITDGTDNHLMLWDVSKNKENLNGLYMQIFCDHVSIALNKNSIVGDKSALTPSAVRLGTPALTSRGLKENDFVKVADFLDKSYELAKTIKKALGTNVNKDSYRAAVASSLDVSALREEIETFAKTFYMPGIDVKNLR